MAAIGACAERGVHTARSKRPIFRTNVGRGYGNRSSGRKESRDTCRHSGVCAPKDRGNLPGTATREIGGRSIDAALGLGKVTAVSNYGVDLEERPYLSASLIPHHPDSTRVNVIRCKANVGQVDRVGSARPVPKI